MIAEPWWASARTAGSLVACGRLLLLTLLSVPAHAQAGPVLQVQPGISIADAVSVPEGVESTTGFSLRFLTRFATSREWLTPLIGAVLLPYGSTGTSNRRTDAPTLFVGNIFRLVPPERTAGWWSLELPLLVSHAPGAASGSQREYGRDLVILPTIYLHLGARGLADFGRLWPRLDLFAQVEQNLTPNRDNDSGKRDRLNPIATFGVSFTLGSTPPDQ